MAPSTPTAWWVIGFFAAEPESVSQDINGEPPTSTQILHGTHAQAVAAAGQAVNGRFFGPYSSQAAAQAAINSGKLAGNQSAAGRVATAASGLTGLNAIGDFFQRLTQAHTWVRVGEVTAGLILLGVGLNHFMGGAPGRAVTKAGKAAMFL